MVTPCPKGRTGHSPVQHPYEDVIQYHIGGKTAYHSDHGPHRAAVISHKRNHTGAEYLQHGSQDDHRRVLFSQDQQLAVCPQRGKKPFRQHVERPSKEHAEQQHHPYRLGGVIPRPFFVPAGVQYGVFDSTAHADSGSGGNQHRSNRIRDVDCGKPRIPDRIAHKKTVHDGVNPGECEGQHGGDHVIKEGSSVTHPPDLRSALFAQTALKRLVSINPPTKNSLCKC